MAVPTIPSTIAASQIQTEFGGANPVGMGEYYSGGTYVGSGTANATSVTIPTSGTIRYSSFSGAVAAAPSAQVLARTAYDFGYNSANCRSIHHTANGICQTDNNTNYSWLLGGANTSYEIRATRTGGTDSASFSTGWANNTWIGLGTSRHIWLYRSSIGLYTAIYSVSIRFASNGTVIQTATHELQADVKK